MYLKEYLINLHLSLFPCPCFPTIGLTSSTKNRTIEIDRTRVFSSKSKGDIVIRLHCLTFLVATFSILAAQSVTVNPGKWVENGIELTPYPSSAFQAKLAEAGPAPSGIDVSALYPVSFFLTNNTGHKIVAYSVVWTVKSSNGHVFQHQRLAGSLRSPNGSLSIPSGASRLVTIVSATSSPVANTLATDSPTTQRVQSSVLSASGMFPSTSEVSISLEAVLLDDGLALGPDSTHAFVRMQAEASADRSLLSDVLTAFNAGGQEAVISLLTGILNGPQAPNSLMASRMSSEADAYAAFSSNFRVQRARSYLGLAKLNPAGLIGIANKNLGETVLSIQRRTP
jgi:hypothetical protein